MTDIPITHHVPANPGKLSEIPQGLQVFTDGSYQPDTGHGGWAFVVYRDTLETASGFGVAEDSGNNSMELAALLAAATWINTNAVGERAVIWSDSIHAVQGCNSWRHIWKNNGWKKISPNAHSRNRTIANADLWKSIDLQLSRNDLIAVAWCKGHSGIGGNERADQLADRGRPSLRPVR